MFYHFVNLLNFYGANLLLFKLYSNTRIYRPLSSSVRKRLIFGDKDGQHASFKQNVLSWKHALNHAKKINNT